MTTNDSVYRSMVMLGSEIIAVLPTWSDGALVAEAAHRAGRANITVRYGEWHGTIRGMCVADAPAATHSGHEAVLSVLGL